MNRIQLRQVLWFILGRLEVTQQIKKYLKLRELSARVWIGAVTLSPIDW